MGYMVGRIENYESEGQIMKAFVAAAKDLGHSPIGKGEPAVTFMLASDWITLGCFRKTTWKIVPRYIADK